MSSSALLLLAHILTSLATQSTIFFSVPAWNVFITIVTLLEKHAAHLTDKAMTLESNGINKRDELNS